MEESVRRDLNPRSQLGRLTCCQLHHGRMVTARAAQGSRTLVAGLQSQCSTTELGRRSCGSRTRTCVAISPGSKPGGPCRQSNPALSLPCSQGPVPLYAVPTIYLTPRRGGSLPSRCSHQATYHSVAHSGLDPFGAVEVRAAEASLDRSAPVGGWAGSPELPLGSKPSGRTDSE